MSRLARKTKTTNKKILSAKEDEVVNIAITLLQQMLTPVPSRKK